MNWTALLRSKTVWGVIIGAGTYLVQLPTGIHIADVLMALSAVITSAGVRSAIATAGSAAPPVATVPATQAQITQNTQTAK